MIGALTFICSICSEPSTRICVYCTKDACENHLCTKCGRCSDCCSCDVPLDEPAPEAVQEAVQEALPEASLEPLSESELAPDEEPSPESAVSPEPGPTG